MQLDLLSYVLTEEETAPPIAAPASRDPLPPSAALKRQYTKLSYYRRLMLRFIELNAGAPDSRGNWRSRCEMRREQILRLDAIAKAAAEEIDRLERQRNSKEGEQ